METTPGAAPGITEPPRGGFAPRPTGQTARPGQPIQSAFPAYPAQPAYPAWQGQAAYSPQQGQPIRPTYPDYPGYPPQQGQQGPAIARTPAPKRATPAAPRMGKAQAQALAARVKKWTLGLSLASFLALGGLVVTHNIVAASAQTSGSSDNGNSSSSVNTDDGQSGTQSGSYFGGQSGSGFGSGNSSAPVSGSRTS